MYIYMRKNQYIHYTKPICEMYVRHSLYGQLLSFNCSLAILKMGCKSIDSWNYNTNRINI